jgi:hypothetical protein
MAMKLQVGESVWIEVEMEDGTTARFRVMGLDRGRLHVSAEDLAVRPDHEGAVILEQSE